MNKFELANWKQYSPKAILPGKSVVLRHEFNSRLLLVRWTRANATPETVGEIEAIIQSPFGTPATPRQTFIVSTIVDYYEFWNVANDGLPYLLSAKLQEKARTGTQLTIWEFTPLSFTSTMGIVNQPNTTDFTPVVNAIAVSGQQQAAATAGMQARLDQIAAAETPATRSAFTEVTVKAFTGATSGSSVAPADTNRPKVVISYPRKNSAGQANNTICYLACGNVQRQGISNYDYILSAGASVTLDEEEAMAMIAIWHEPTQGNQNQDVVLNLSTFTR
jgi:hypothetical protein